MAKTVPITATQKFLHEDGRYAKGKTYDVAPELAAYFVGNGWATSDKVPEGARTTILPTLMCIRPVVATRPRTEEVIYG